MDELVVAGVTTVTVGRGVLDPPALLDGLAPERIAIVTQPGVPAALSAGIARGIGEAGLTVTVLEVPDGEEAKTLSEVERLCAAFSDSGMTRGDLVMAVGGGAVSDLAGFAAAVYLRGVPAVYVPTTLLGAVDASIGGKTAVNARAKNQIGVFRHPARVVVDVDVLDALPDEAKRQGAAEALKTGLIGDDALVALFEDSGLEADLEEVVRRSLAVKGAIVGRDFEESGERAHLNYGHTVGHAVEVAGPLPHGSAVAVGMVAAGRVSALTVGFDDEERQREVIVGLGLPTSAPVVDLARIDGLIGLDKKRTGSRSRFVVLEAIGRPLVVEVEAATVRAALAAVGIGVDQP